MLDKIVNRIEKSIACYNEFQRGGHGVASVRVYTFDDNLVIEAYNGIYKISFKGQVLTHCHGDDRIIIRKALIDKKNKLKEYAISQL